MFNDSKYDCLEFFPPTNGMNRNISRYILPKNFAFTFENVLPLPLGETQVRFGNSLIFDALDDSNYSILEAFPFQTTSGNKQIVAYLSYYQAYVGATNLTFLGISNFSFTPNGNPYFYEIDTSIEIGYNAGAGNVITYANITNIVTLLNGDISVSLDQPVLELGATILSFRFSKGKIVIYDFATNAILPVVGVDNLHVGVVPRKELAFGTLIMCNGVDPIYSWDGNLFSKVSDLVKEQADAFNRIDNTHFSFTVNSAFDISKYPINSDITLVINGVADILTVVSISQAALLVTITTSTNIPAFAGQDRVALFYLDYPPPFNFLYVSNDRIWGLAPGAVSLNYRAPGETLKVYYSYRTNSVTNWFNENTKTVPSIDISSKHGEPDNLEAISTINGLTAFIGRKNTQVWSGKDPTNPESPDAFVFNSVLPMGIVHGNLICELPNDTYFVSQNGIMSFGTFNIARQFVASSMDAVDPLVRQDVISTTTSNIAYRACRSFKYNSGSFCGFKIGLNPVLVGVYNTNIYSWSSFSGDFQFATTFLSDLDNALYICINGGIYQYADGIDLPPSYGDNNGQNLINFVWSFPTSELKGKKFSNNFYELRLDYPSSFVINEGNTISISIDGDVRETFSLTDNVHLDVRGDVFASIPLEALAAPDPNNPNATDIGMRLDIPYHRIIERFKFISSNFLVTIYGQAKNGLVKFNRLKLFGKVER